MWRDVNSVHYNIVTYSLESVILVSGAMCGTVGNGGDEFLEPCLDESRLIVTGLGLFISLK